MTGAPLELPPATVIGGQYRIIGTIGVGGSGTVYRAHRLGMTQQVALKLMHAGHPESESEHKRFAREAEVVKRLQHPNVVDLLDYGLHDDSTPFLVQPLLEGETLEQKLERGPLSWQQTGALSVHVLRALEKAHSMDIAHRDIKPANIFVTRGVLGEVAQVLDFGLAKVVRGDLDDQMAVTRVGAVLGTPRYMAPEQARGEQVGLVADIYSFGLVMAEMLLGRPLITGDNEVQIYAQQGSDRPLTLPPAILQSPWASIIQRAVAKPLDVRYRLASQMLADVRAVVERLGGGASLEPAEADMDATRMLDPRSAIPLSTPNETSEKLRNAFNVIAKKRADAEAPAAAPPPVAPPQPAPPPADPPPRVEPQPASQRTVLFPHADRAAPVEPTAMFDLASQPSQQKPLASIGIHSHAATSGAYAAQAEPSSLAALASTQIDAQPPPQPPPQAQRQPAPSVSPLQASPAYYNPYPPMPSDPFLAALEPQRQRRGLVAALVVVLILLAVAVGLLIYLLAT